MSIVMMMTTVIDVVKNSTNSMVTNSCNVKKDKWHYSDGYVDITITIAVDEKHDADCIYYKFNNNTHIVFRFTPESIRWYLTHDKIEKAQEKLVEIAKTNKKEYTEEPSKIPTSSSSKDLRCLALFATWPLFISNMVQASAW